MITLTITPIENVDYIRKHVLDNEQVLRISYDWNDPLTVFDVENDREETVKAGAISLFDHRLIHQGKRFHMLHFFSEGWEFKIMKALDIVKTPKGPTGLSLRQITKGRTLPLSSSEEEIQPGKETHGG